MKLFTLLWLTSGLLIAGAASAQTEFETASVETASAESTQAAIPQTAPAQAASVPADEFKLPIMIWAAAVTSDQITTYRFSSQYPTILHETNPLIRGLDHHPAWLVAAGTAMDAATGWAIYHFFGKRHPRLVKIAFYAAAAYRAHLAAHNLQMMERAQQIQTLGRSTIPR